MPWQTRTTWQTPNDDGIVHWITSDGTNLYAFVQNGLLKTTCYLVKLDPSTMTEISRITYSTQSPLPSPLAGNNNLGYYDGTYIYLSIQTTTTPAVVKIDPGTMTEIGRYTTPADTFGQSAVTGNAIYIYLSAQGINAFSVYQINPATMGLVNTYADTTGAHTAPYGLVVMGGVLYVFGWAAGGGGSGMFFKIDPTTMAYHGDSAVAGRPETVGLTTDGTSIYTEGFDSGSGNSYFFKSDGTGYSLEVIGNFSSINYSNSLLLCSGASGPNILLDTADTNTLAVTPIWSTSNAYGAIQAPSIYLGGYIYVGGYTSNSGGTFLNPIVYQLEFITLLPTVVTDAATAIQTESAQLNGQLNDDGGEACTCGFQWGPTIAYGNTTPTTSQVTGDNFNQVISSLTPGLTYHFRTFAMNLAGTAYGSDLTFSTPIPTQHVMKMSSDLATIISTSPLVVPVSALGGKNGNPSLYSVDQVNDLSRYDTSVNPMVQDDSIEVAGAASSVEVLFVPDSYVSDWVYALCNSSLGVFVIGQYDPLDFANAPNFLYGGEGWTGSCMCTLNLKWLNPFETAYYLAVGLSSGSTIATYSNFLGPVIRYIEGALGVDGTISAVENCDDWATNRGEGGFAFYAGINNTLLSTPAAVVLIDYVPAG